MDILETTNIKFVKKTSLVMIAISVTIIFKLLNENVIELGSIFYLALAVILLELLGMLVLTFSSISFRFKENLFLFLAITCSVSALLLLGYALYINIFTCEPNPFERMLDHL